jgi:catechol 2,3-dioxygenase-like lactoylglutathione lyase family enzyme
MIGYVTLGTNDLARAARFYDGLLIALGATRWLEGEREIVWARPEGGPAISVLKPFDGRPATVGNGVMVGLAMGSRAEVDALYAIALNLGASDEGKPGPRGSNFYAAYFRDLDGNKLNAFFIG